MSKKATIAKWQRRGQVAALCAVIGIACATGYIQQLPDKPIRYLDWPEEGQKQAENERPDTESDNLAERLLAYESAPKPAPKPETPVSGPITGAQLRLYKSIRKAQEKGNWNRADKLISELEDPRLMGRVLYQRYMHPDKYDSSYTELADWLDLYADQPGADDIFRLGRYKAPQDTGRALREPESVSGIRGYLEFQANFQEAYRSPRKRTQAQYDRVNEIMRNVRAQVRQGNPGQALLMLDEVKGNLDQTELNMMRSVIASGYLYTGSIKTGLDLAERAAAQSGADVPLAGWVAGIGNWRLSNFKESAQYFEMAATSPYADGWTIAGAAFWASRAHMRTGNFEAVSKWLNRATDFPRTFYGLIALRALAQAPSFNWHVPEYDLTQREVLLSHSEGVRAVALAEMGETGAAEQELLRLHPEDDEVLEQALLSIAVDKQMPTLSWRLGGAVPQEDGSFYDAALYPVLPWVENYKVDRALVHAFVRQESKYKPEAENPSGATGLMQLLPSTAEGLVGEDEFAEIGGAEGLKNPAVNVEIGQDYIKRIFDYYVENNDLFGLLISWNAGPGNYQRWKKGLNRIDDSLLFIESIPAYETRAFVERVMTYYWIYRMRLGQETPSLDAVVEGDWPIYKAQE